MQILGLNYNEDVTPQLVKKFKKQESVTVKIENISVTITEQEHIQLDYPLEEFENFKSLIKIWNWYRYDKAVDSLEACKGLFVECVVCSIFNCDFNLGFFYDMGYDLTLVTSGVVLNIDVKKVHKNSGLYISKYTTKPDKKYFSKYKNCYLCFAELDTNENFVKIVRLVSGDIFEDTSKFSVTTISKTLFKINLDSNAPTMSFPPLSFLQEHLPIEKEKSMSTTQQPDLFLNNVSQPRNYRNDFIENIHKHNYDFKFVPLKIDLKEHSENIKSLLSECYNANIPLHSVLFSFFNNRSFGNTENAITYLIFTLRSLVKNPECVREVSNFNEIFINLFSRYTKMNHPDLSTLEFVCKKFELHNRTFYFRLNYRDNRNDFLNRLKATDFNLEKIENRSVYEKEISGLLKDIPKNLLSKYYDCNIPLLMNIIQMCSCFEDSKIRTQNVENFLNICMDNANLILKHGNSKAVFEIFLDYKKTNHKNFKSLESLLDTICTKGQRNRNSLMHYRDYKKLHSLPQDGSPVVDIVIPTVNPTPKVFSTPKVEIIPEIKTSTKISELSEFLENFEVDSLTPKASKNLLKLFAQASK